ncbi:YqaA family protein [Marinobacter daqiaonensis]|uniref:YqaA family protein n=1 Tax=Marinobacter daqiaonensis TaxID=650891 RepID=UPI00158028AA|nr:YqaA family protein [Marinobacter daqiaonensis]
MFAYGSLFLAAFAAATFFPFQSEALLVGLLVADTYSVTLLLVVATAGNVLGSVVNWYMGRYIEKFRYKRWFPFKGDSLEKAQGHYHRWGRWSLLMSWAPFIGDPLTLIAGIMRERFWTFLWIVTIAKAGRYLVTALLTFGWINL